MMDLDKIMEILDNIERSRKNNEYSKAALASIELARECGVKEDRIIKSTDDLDRLFS